MILKKTAVKKKEKAKSIPDNKAINSFPRLLECLFLGLFIGTLITIILVNIPSLVFNFIVIPNNFFSILIVGFVLTIAFTLTFYFVWKSRIMKWAKIIILVFLLLFETVLMTVGFYIANTLVFFDKADVGIYDDIPYSVVVRKDSQYNSVKDLTGQKIGLFKEIDAPGIHTMLQKNTNTNYKTVVAKNNINEMAEKLLNGSVEAIVIEQGRLRFLNEEISGFEENTRVIYSFGLQSKAYKTENYKSPSEPFVVYISDIIQYDDSISIIGQNKLNQLLVVNPKSREMLFVNMPQNLYIELDDNNSYDMIANARIYGMEKNIKAIEKLYDVDVNCYIEIKLDVLENLLNESEKTYTDQQQITAKVADKILNSSFALNNYNHVLQTLDEGVQTDMSSEMFFSLLLDLKNTSSDWKIEYIPISGNEEMKQIYSLGNNQLKYVMIPGQDSIDRIKTKIKTMLNGEDNV